MLDKQSHQDIETFRRDLKLQCELNVKNLYDSSLSIIDINKSIIYITGLFSNFLLVLGILPFILILYIMFRLSFPFIAMFPVIIVTLAVEFLYSSTIGMLKIFLIVVSAHEHKIITSVKELLEYWSGFLKKYFKEYLQLEMKISYRVGIDFLVGLIPTFIILNLLFYYISGANFLYSYFISNIANDTTLRVYSLFKLISLVLSFIIGIIRTSYLTDILSFSSIVFIENKLTEHQETTEEIIRRNDKLFEIIGVELLINYNVKKTMIASNFLDIQDIAYFYCFYKFIFEETKKNNLI